MINQTMRGIPEDFELWRLMRITRLSAGLRFWQWEEYLGLVRKLGSPDNPGIKHKVAHGLPRFGQSVGIDVLLLGHRWIIMFLQLLLLVWRQRHIGGLAEAQAPKPMAPKARAPRHVCLRALPPTLVPLE